MVDTDTRLKVLSLKSSGTGPKKPLLLYPRLLSRLYQPYHLMSSISSARRRPSFAMQAAKDHCTGAPERKVFQRAAPPVITGQQKPTYQRIESGVPRQATHEIVAGPDHDDVDILRTTRRNAGPFVSSAKAYF